MGWVSDRVGQVNAGTTVHLARVGIVTAALRLPSKALITAVGPDAGAAPTDRQL